MKRIGTAALSLVALLYQPVEAQRTQSSDPARQTQNVQRDVEFLRVHEAMSALEEKLQRNSVRVMDKDIGARKVYRSGLGEILDTTLPPDNIGDKVENAFYDRVAKLSARYGKTISRNAIIFTSGNSVIAADSNHGEGNFIFDENSLVLRNAQVSNDQRVYSVFYSYFKNGKMEAYQFPDVINGVIPIFRMGDFIELYEKIRQFEIGERKSLEQGYGVNHGKVNFFWTIRMDIASMLVKLALPDYSLDYPSYSNVGASANRIIITGSSGSELMNSHRIVSMSIGSSGDVKYWSSAYKRNARNNIEVIGSPVYADIKIRFPISP